MDLDFGSTFKTNSRALFPSAYCLTNPGPYHDPIPPKQQHHSQNFRSDHNIYNHAGITERQYNDPRAHRTVQGVGKTGKGGSGSPQGETYRRSSHDQAHAAGRRLCKCNRCGI